MAEERFLITGAYGCVGAWAVRRLVAEGVPVWTYDLPGDPHRFRLVMDDETMLQVKQVDGDITEAGHFERVVAENGISHIKAAVEAGADEYVMKPFDRETLESKLAIVGVI